LEDAGSTTIRAVGHSEQLAQSLCARASRGRLWCGTCHDPHAPNNNRPAQVRQVCLSCHELIFAAAKHAPAAECVTCHMPRLSPVDVAHSAVTDHRIVRRLKPDTPAAAVAIGLRPWRDPDSTLAQRDLGLAYFGWTASQPDPDKLTRAYDLLSHLTSGATDPPVLADLASILLQQGQFNLSVQLFTKAAQGDPMNARYAYCVGMAQERAGDAAAAIKELRRSITLDPSQPEPYLALARIYETLGQESRKLATLREYLRFMPQNLSLRSKD
jgi:predicted CXXCH cytochrome family protein